MKTVVLITTGQPSINPRIVKEADALQKAGYEVIVLYCSLISWADHADEKLLNNVCWKYKLVGGSPVRSRRVYYFTKLRLKLNSALSKKGFKKYSIAERSQARCYDELVKAAKSIKAHLYVGHNLGALPVAAKAAQYNNAFAGFDFEDYHRLENEGEKISIQKRVIYLEEKYVPHLSYISTSSPLIKIQIRRDFPRFNKLVFSLLNCFPLLPTHRKETHYHTDGTLQLFWFSQTVGRNRGLQAVVTALVRLNNPLIHLTLAGRVDESFVDFINENAKTIKAQIHLPGIIHPQKLSDFAARYDVGLATEKSTPLNRNICLANKIFIYLLAGNCILASDTDAQKELLNSHNDIGLLYKNEDIEDLAEKINFLFDNREALNRYKASAYHLAVKELNWENESRKLLHHLSSLLQVANPSRVSF